MIATINLSPPLSAESTLNPPTAGGNDPLDWVRSFLEFFASVAWPMTILAVLFVLLRKKNRQTIAYWLKPYAALIRKIRFGEFEASFGEAEASKVLEGVAALIERPSETAPDNEVNPENSQNTSDVFQPAVSKLPQTPADPVDSTPAIFLTAKVRRVDKTLSPETRDRIEQLFSFGFMERTFPPLASDPRIRILDYFSILDWNLRNSLHSLDSPDVNKLYYGNPFERIPLAYNLSHRVPLQLVVEILYEYGFVSRNAKKAIKLLEDMRNVIALDPEGSEISEKAASDFATQADLIASSVHSNVVSSLNSPG